jgi:hypothetical protein
MKWCNAPSSVRLMAQAALSSTTSSPFPSWMWGSSTFTAPSRAMLSAERCRRQTSHSLFCSISRAPARRIAEASSAAVARGRPRAGVVLGAWWCGEQPTDELRESGPPSARSRIRGRAVVGVLPRMEALWKRQTTADGNRITPPRLRIDRNHGIWPQTATHRNRPARLHTREVAGSKPAAPIDVLKVRGPTSTHAVRAGRAMLPIPIPWITPWLWTCSGSRRRERASSMPPRRSSRPPGSRWRALRSRQDWS